MNKLEELHKIFSNVNDWLKFAEAKNAVLLGVISTILGFTFSKISEFPQDSLVIVKFIFIPAGTLALFIILASFFPPFEFRNSNINKNEIEKRKNRTKNNIFYFGYLKDINLNSLINYFEILQGEKVINMEQKICRDLIEQIITNSKITSRKLKLFNYGGLILFLGATVSALIYLIKIIF